jgi:stage II sporulation protein D
MAIPTTIGRAYAVDVTLASGAVMKNISANDFRLAIGYERGELESTFFTVAQSEDQIKFEGQGFGHGVGMCQFGAKYLAEKKGWDYRSILERYYTGVQLVRLW